MTVPIVYRSTDNTKWGPGKGSKLTIAEGDGNLWELVKAITDLQENPPSPADIANILVSGSQMQIQLTNGKTFGPFSLPVAAFRYRKDGYNVGDTYNALDLLPITDGGLYMVLSTHVATGEFDPDAVDGSGKPLFLLLFGQDQRFISVDVSIIGKPGAGLTATDPIYMRYFREAGHIIAATDSGATVGYLITPPAADLTLEVWRGDAEQLGTIDIASGSNDAIVTWSDDAQIAADETLIIKAPAAVDADAEHLALTLTFRVGPLP
jgi:hypothetical protein